jgi:hypothetical protein
VQVLPIVVYIIALYSAVVMEYSIGENVKTERQIIMSLGWYDILKSPKS